MREEWPEAEVEYRRAYDIILSQPVTQPDRVRIVDQLARFLRMRGREDEAAEIERASKEPG